MHRSPSRVAELDGLRGAAILLVLISHFDIYGFDQPASGLGRLVYKAAETGWVGVDLFFVLSGFLITGILYRAKGGSRYFVNFYARRTLRIFPLYFGFLAIAVGVLPWLAPQSARLAAWLRESPWYWTYTGNLFAARHGWSSPSAQGLNHFWSLAVEEQFYLAWPIAVFLLGRRQLIWLCTAATVVSLTLRMLMVAMHAHVAAYVLMPARMDALAAGALVALILAGPVSHVTVGRIARALLGAFALSLVALVVLRHTADPEDPVMETIGFCCLAGLFASLVATLVTPGMASLRTIFQMPPMKALGKYSYGLYVVHHPLLFLVPPIQLAATLQRYVPNFAVAHVMSLALVFLLCTSIAVVSWHWFEQPILKLKDRFVEPVALARSDELALDGAAAS